MNEQALHASDNRLSRRAFVAASVCAPALAVAALVAAREAARSTPAGAPAAALPAADASPAARGYHETEHIRTYYRTAAYL